MVKITLIRKDKPDEAVPRQVEISRVPCIGEEIYAAPSDPPDHRPSAVYRVEGVLHEVGFPMSSHLVARVFVVEVKPPH